MSIPHLGVQGVLTVSGVEGWRGRVALIRS